MSEIMSNELAEAKAENARLRGLLEECKPIVRVRRDEEEAEGAMLQSHGSNGNGYFDFAAKLTNLLESIDNA